MLTLYLPALARLFLFTPLRWSDSLLALGLGLLGVLWFEAVKLIRHRSP